MIEVSLRQQIGRRFSSWRRQHAEPVSMLEAEEVDLLPLHAAVERRACSAGGVGAAIRLSIRQWLLKRGGKKNSDLSFDRIETPRGQKELLTQKPPLFSLPLSSLALSMGCCW